MTSQTMQQIEAQVQQLLTRAGLKTLGWFGDDAGCGLLIGNVGSGLWPSFSGSAEYADGLPNPMDRWTVSIVGPVARELGADIRYPFGDTVWPFQHYARQAMGIDQSPIGLLIHPEFGLWSAFRAALIFEREGDAIAPMIAVSPCDSCVDKPCLSSCPIGAFTPQGFDYRSCKTHVASADGAACFTNGCLARQACPVGKDHAYSPEHQNFHMCAYI